MPEEKKSKIEALGLDEALEDTGVYGPDLGLATVARQLFPEEFKRSIVS